MKHSPTSRLLTGATTVALAAGGVALTGTAALTLLVLILTALAAAATGLPANAVRIAAKRPASAVHPRARSESI